MMPSQPPSLEDQIDALLRADAIPGIVAWIRKDGKNIVRIAKGYANLETRTKMSINSVHELASVSKQFTAAAAMKLVEEGKLSLDDHISKFVDEPPVAWQTITIQNLLEHSSGLPDYLSEDMSVSEDTDSIRLLARIKDVPLVFAPGSRWEYSNSGYMALGQVIARASGVSFRTYVETNILAPAGMKTACVSDPTKVLKNRASGYSRGTEEWRNEAYVSTGLSSTGDGMLMASAHDLLAWHNALRNGLILSKASWQKMWTPSPQSDGKYGFGVFVDRAGAKPRIRHGGSWVGTGTFFMSDIETDSAIVILINCDRAPIEDLIKAATAML